MAVGRARQADGAATIADPVIDYGEALRIVHRVTLRDRPYGPALPPKPTPTPTS